MRLLYGVAGTSKAEYCRQHAKEGMVGVLRKRSTLNDCIVWASLDIAGSRMSYPFTRHSPNGAVNVVEEVPYVNGVEEPSFVVSGTAENLSPRGSKQKDAGHSLTEKNEDSPKKT